MAFPSVPSIFPAPPAPPAPPAAPTTPSIGTGGGSFSSQLKGAMSGGTAAATTTPAPPAAATTAAAPAGGPVPADPAALPAADPAAEAGAGAAPAAKAAPGTYPHLTGDLDASPEILQRLEALAAKKGMKFQINSGHRSIEEQQRLWDNRHNNPLPVAPPGKSRHQSGRACDVSIGGRPIQAVISDAELRAAGLVPLKGDAPHVELP